jgi:hypothetical protein
MTTRNLEETPRFSAWSFPEVLALLTALGVALYFRFVHMETTWMSLDQSTLLKLAMDIGSGRRFPRVANQSSAGLAHPALPVYLYAIPLALTHQILSAAYLTALLNSISVGISYLFARRFLGRAPALIFLSLYAASPWSVHFSRLIWNPVMIPFFATLALWLLTEAISGNRRFLIWIGVACTLMGVFHSHLASMALLISIGTTWLFFYRQVRFKGFAVSLLLVALSFLPYALSQPTLWLLLTGTASGETAKVNLSPFLLAGDLVSARGLFLATGIWKAVENLLRGWLWFSLVWLGILTLRCLPKARQGSISSAQAARIVLFLWIAGPLVALIRHTHYLQHHYLLFLYPAAYLAMASALTDVGVALHRLISPRFSRLRQIGPIIGVGGLVLIFASLSGWSLFVSNAVLRQEQSQTCFQEQHVRAAVNTIRAELDRSSIRDLVILSDGIDASYSTFGFINAFLPPHISVRFTRLGNGLSVPAAPTLYFVAGEDIRTLAMLDRIGYPLRLLDVSPCGVWKFYVTTQAWSFTGGSSRPIAEWANGLQLWGYQIERAVRGDNLALTTFWKVRAERPLNWDYFFFHLFSPEAVFISQMDGPGVSSPYWREGDWLILLTTLPIPGDAPPGPYEIYCGLYSVPSLERIPVVAGDATDNRLHLTTIWIP